MEGIKLNLGCGHKLLKGFENLDLFPFNNKVIKHDLNKKLPYKDNSVSYVLCEHTLSYLDDPAKFLHDLHRVCKKNAKIDLIVNHFSLAFAYAELRKKRSGFSYFMLGEYNWNREFYKMFKVKKHLNFTRVNFQFLNYILNPIINLSPMLYERFLCYLLPCSEIHFKLRVLK